MTRNENTNNICFFGLPLCGFGFESSRHCFVACPSDDESQLEIDIIKSELEKRNYEHYVAVEHFEGGKNVFCNKICSKIITSHFCIVLLNESKHRKRPSTTMPNPNVHFEYGMMAALNKRVIPMARRDSGLAFNIAPLDTLLYTKGEFADLVSKALDGEIGHFAKQKSPEALGFDRDIVRFMSLNGLVLSDAYIDLNKMVWGLGSSLGFFLFEGSTYAFFANMETESEQRIAFNLRLLANNINSLFDKIENLRMYSVGPSAAEANRVKLMLERIQIFVLVRSEAKVEPIEKFFFSQPETARTGVDLHLVTRSAMQAALDDELNSITLW